MKIILTIILLLPLSVWGMSPVICGGGGGTTTAFCAGAATCTATNPGECDLLCEDFEGSSDCDGVGAGTDANCRNSYTVSTGAGDTVDFTTTGATGYCSGTTSTNVLQFTVSAASHNTDAYFQWGADKTTLYVQLYFNLTSDSSASPNANKFIIVTNSSSQDAWSCGYKNVSGTLRGYCTYRKNDTTYSSLTGSTKALSTNTWYRLRVSVDEGAGTISAIYANADGTSSETLSASNVGNDRVMRRIYLGTQGNQSAFTVQIDNVTVDDDTMAGACL